MTATTDANGDLVYSEASGLYAAYFVVTGKFHGQLYRELSDKVAYTTDYSGHFGDSIQYVTESTGAIQTITGASSTFGCSHNTGIGLEAADAAPFASICAEDQGDIWLNTNTQYMSGVKIANENTTNGVSGEPMGGMSGSYSNLALFPNTTNYVFAWQSRGALALTENAWMGTGYAQCSPRWLNHNVAITTMSSKDTLRGSEATSVVGAAEGDTQVTWITYSDSDDHQNVHVAALNSDLSVVSWETLSNPTCEPVPLSCSGTYAGTSFQFVDSAGTKIGSAINSTSVFVSGDFANVGTDKVCWPYVDMTWDLSAAKDSGTPVTKMSFACVSSGGSTAVGASSSSARSPVSSDAIKVVESSSISSAPIQTTFAASVTIATTLSAIETPTISSSAVEEAIQTTFALSVTIATTLSAIESLTISSSAVEEAIQTTFALSVTIATTSSAIEAVPTISSISSPSTSSSASLEIVYATSIVTVVPIAVSSPAVESSTKYPEFTPVTSIPASTSLPSDSAGPQASLPLETGTPYANIPEFTPVTSIQAESTPAITSISISTRIPSSIPVAPQESVLSVTDSPYANATSSTSEAPTKTTKTKKSKTKSKHHGNTRKHNKTKTSEPTTLQTVTKTSESAGVVTAVPAAAERVKADCDE